MLMRITARTRTPKQFPELFLLLRNCPVRVSRNLQLKIPKSKNRFGYFWRRRRDSPVMLMRITARTRTPKQFPELFLLLRNCPVRVSRNLQLKIPKPKNRFGYFWRRRRDSNSYCVLIERFK